MHGVQQRQVGEAGSVLAQAIRLDGILQRDPIKKRVIAQQFPPLLREFREYSGAINGTCPDEPQFRGMFEVLGDRDAQEDIRLAHPKVDHCIKLMQNAKACIGCAKNPMKPEKLEKRERIEAGNHWLQSSFDLEQAARLGLLSMATIDSTEQILLSAARHHEEFNRDERLAILITHKMYEVFGPLLGVKK